MESKASGRQIVVVQGLGFVGSAASAAISAANLDSGEPRFTVVGVDLLSPEGYWKISKIQRGLTPFSSPDPSLANLIKQAVCENHNLYATVSSEIIEFADIVVVDIPLDVTNRASFMPEEIELNLTGFETGIRTIGKFMGADALVLIETTVPIGTIEYLVQPILLEERRKRGIQSTLYLAHAYERVMPGPQYINSIRRFWRSYSGINPESAERANQFLVTFIDTTQFSLWKLTDSRSSEMAKLLENSYRAVNIAFIQEWTLLAEQIGINLFEVVELDPSSERNS